MDTRLLFSLIASLLITDQAIAEIGDKKITSKMGESGAPRKKNKAIFYPATNTLKLPVVHNVDANGKMTKTLYAVELDLSSPIEGEANKFKVIKLNETDEYGCILPETWQESWGHCMVQN